MQWRAAVVLASVLLSSVSARAFPPYRSTDAETADPWTLETRLGLVRIEHDRGEEEYTSPLLRVNFGFPRNVELVSEFEYRADETRVADAAVGTKWVPVVSTISLGTEMLCLLPTEGQMNGAGFEGQVLATHKRDWMWLHLNAGGFHDARPAETEGGWRSSLLAEFPLGWVRPGVEVFAKGVSSDPAEISAGPGVIAKLGRIDLRLGVHAGLTGAAPDLRMSLWIATKFPLR
jgi:hypothetical protein